MKKSTLIMMVSIVLAIALGVGGTLAYLTSTDEDVNVMTLGNVSIAQLEYERVTDEDGNWIATGETDKYGYTPDEIKDFTQAKPLYPAYFADGKIKWDDRNGSEAASGEGSHQQSWGQVKGEKATGAPGSNQLFDDSVYGAQDKFVFVENTGTSDAYVRTWFAFELGSVEADKFFDIVELNNNDANGEAGAGHWAWEWQEGAVEIDGNNYRVACATYLGPKSNPTGILAPGTISYPSLLQVYMKPTATNEDVAAIDGNGNGMYDILVKSQATQTTNFPDAQTALETSFGDDIPWDEVNGPIIVYNTDELREAMKIPGAEIWLGDDLVVDDDKGTGYCYYAKYDNIIQLNGHDITVDLPGKLFNGVFYVLNGAQLDIYGEGNVVIENGVGQWIWSTGASGDTKVNIYGGNWVLATENEPNFCEGLYANREGVVNVYGGTFDWGDEYTKYTVNESRGGQVYLQGGTYVNFDPSISHDGDNSYVAEGYKVVSEEQENGDIWYTVVPE